MSYFWKCYSLVIWTTHQRYFTQLYNHLNYKGFSAGKVFQQEMREKWLSLEARSKHREIQKETETSQLWELTPSRDWGWGRIIYWERSSSGIDFIAKPEGRAEESVVRTGAWACRAPWKCTASPQCSAKCISLNFSFFPLGYSCFIMC